MFKFNNFFYNEVKDIVENRHLTRYQIVHWINILINFAFIIRFAYTLAVHFNPTYAITNFDVFARIFSFDSENKDFSFVATFIGLSISTGLLEAKLYFSRIDTVTWQVCEHSME